LLKEIEEINVTRRQGRKRKQLLDDLKMREYWKIKNKDALDHRSGYRPATRRTTE
jgi:hypothetical protein